MILNSLFQSVLEMPVLLKILSTFVFVLILTHRKLHLGVALIIGTLGMLLWLQCGVTVALQVIFQGMFSINALLLYSVVFLIVLLSSLLESSGMIRRILVIARSMIHSRRAVFAALPAVIGFLPMPGGAAFSAPMLQAADDRDRVSAVEKTAINYWFRHIWEYWWPLYPGALLAWELSGLTFLQFALIQSPLTLISIAAGTVFLLLPLDLGAKDSARPDIPKKEIVISGVAILLPMVSFIFGLLIEKVFGLSLGKFLPMIPGLIGSLAWVQWFSPSGFDSWRSCILSRRTWLLILTVAGVMAFSSALKAPVTPPLTVDANSVAPSAETVLVLDLLHHDLVKWSIPPILVMMFIPFLAGFVTGLAYGFVGTSLPIVMTLAGEKATTSHIMSCLVIGYAFGYIGMMLSPVHICLLVTKDYFAASMSKVYRKILPPSLCILVGALLLSLFASRIL